MYIDVEIGPYKVEQRTAYSKLKILNIKENKDISETFDGIKIAKKIIEDYKQQIDNKDEYFQITNGTLNTVTGKISEDNIKFLFIPKEVVHLGGESLNHSNFEYICLSDSLKEIDESAFFLCTHLKEVFLPDSVKTIHDDIFEHCEQLESIRLPNNIEKINKGTFSGCKSLKNIIIPDSVEVIENAAFYNCVGLKDVKLSKNLKTIKDYAFTSCDKLEEILLPNSLESIEDDAFCGCKSLKRIIIPDSVNNIGSGAFYDCESLTEVKLPKNIDTIREFTFGNCYELRNFSFPDSIMALNNNIFWNNSNLENITLPKNLKTIQGPIFEKNRIVSLTFNYDLKDIIFQKFENLEEYDLLVNSNIDKLIIDANVSTITPKAFAIDGKQIISIDYLGTKEQFEKFKNNNKELFKNLPNLEKINFIDDKEKERTKSITPER